MNAESQQRALQIIAKSLYKELRRQGYAPREIVTLSSELLGLLTADLRGGPQARATCPGLRPPFLAEPFFDRSGTIGQSSE